MSTPASRSGAQYALAHRLDDARVEREARWMIGARSGHATAHEAAARRRRPDRPRVGAAGDGRRRREQPERPLRVAGRPPAARRGHDAEHVDARRASRSRSRSAGSAAAVAALQATTSSFAPLVSSGSAISTRTRAARPASLAVGEAGRVAEVDEVPPRTAPRAQLCSTVSPPTDEHGDVAAVGHGGECWQA